MSRSRMKGLNSSMQTRICRFDMRYGKCAICGQYGDMDRHHVFGGTARQISERYGAVIDVCRGCHRSIHDHRSAYAWLQAKTQTKVMYEQGWDLEEWMAHFHRNYL